MALRENDFIRIHLATETIDLLCEENGMDWPPPELIYLSFAEDVIRRGTYRDPMECLFIRVRMSQLPDTIPAQVRIARGAEYERIPEDEYNRVRTEALIKNRWL